MTVADRFDRPHRWGGAEVMGDLPGGALGGRRGGALWRMTGDARKAEARVAAAET